MSHRLAVGFPPGAGELEVQYPNLAAVLLDSIPSSALILDRGLRITMANRNFLEKARWRRDSTVGRRLDEVFPATILNATRLERRTRAVLQDGTVDEGGKMTYRAPGVPQNVYFYSLTPLREGDVVTGVLLLMHDVTEQERLTEDVRRIERHLVSVVESANDLVVSMDPDGQIMTWNPAAEQVSGFRMDEVIGRSLTDLCEPGDRQDMVALLEAVRQGTPTKVRDLRLKAREGNAIPVAWACSPVRDDQGRATALVAVGRDLTERRLLEAQLFQSAKMASLGVMAGGIAHELRNPLGAASAAAQLLLRETEDLDLSRQCAQKIYDGIKRASAIIESLLRFARPTDGRHATIAVNEVVSDTMVLMGRQAALQQVRLETELLSDLPPIWGDRSALQQVFTNLFLNACQAMPTGGRLLVRTHLLPDEPSVGVDFVDTGCGIPPENLSKIFDPFFTTRPVGQGVGLGLTISYSILQQYGGRIEVESTPGVGSTFRVRMLTRPFDYQS